MKIAACQFAVSANIRKNMEAMEKAAAEAKKKQIELLVFPECALTGYPPRDLPSAAQADFTLIEAYCAKLEKISGETQIAFVAGTIAKEAGQIYNRAVFFAPGAKPSVYDKRALWGWDRDNFTPGNKKGVFEYKGFRIGVRICFEVRFPEYFRELYKEKTDLDAVLFYDVSDTDDTDRYQLIRGHLQTRAVENVCTVVSANTIRPFQTAPTAVFGRSGQVIAECPRNLEGFAEYVLEKKAYDFGEKGRADISDALLAAR